jgi:uncharacterized delta-60 repeat protein
MIVASSKWFRGLLLAGIYVLGVLGIVGSGGSGSGGGKNPFEISLCDPPPDPDPFNICGPPAASGTSGFNAAVSSIAPALDSSDDVYVGGDFTIYKNLEANHIARLNNDGSLDTGFVTGTGFNNSLPLPSVCCERVKTVAPATDGSGDIYVGGTFTSYNGTAIGRIARLNIDGSLDMGFATGTGFDYVPGTGFTGGIRIIVPANDGSGDIYVGGIFTSYNGTNVGSGIIRLNNDGSLDTGFSTGSGWGEDSISPANDGSGDVYVARRSSPGIARLNDDGTLDAGFDTGPTGFNDGARNIAAAMDGSGDVYASGFFSDYNATVTNGLARLNSNGSLDAGFVTDTGFLSFGNFITPMIDGSGDIYVESNAGDVTRLNDDGSIDTGFDIGLIGFNSFPDCVALTTDGSGDIYVGGGFSTYNLTPHAHMVRLTDGGVFVR